MDKPKMTSHANYPFRNTYSMFPGVVTAGFFFTPKARRFGKKTNLKIMFLVNVNVYSIMHVKWKVSQSVSCIQECNVVIDVKIAACHYYDNLMQKPPTHFAFLQIILPFSRQNSNWQNLDIEIMPKMPWRQSPVTIFNTNMHSISSDFKYMFILYLMIKKKQVVHKPLAAPVWSIAQMTSEWKVFSR